MAGRRGVHPYVLQLDCEESVVDRVDALIQKRQRPGGSRPLNVARPMELRILTTQDPGGLICAAHPSRERKVAHEAFASHCGIAGQCAWDEPASGRATVDIHAGVVAEQPAIAD